MKTVDINQWKATLSYDSETGLFTRLKASGNRKIGSVAGSKCGEGYIHIRNLNVVMQAHRLAFAFYYGYFAIGQVDHINGNKSDNRIENLRDVTHTENQQNRKCASKISKSGYLGVHWHARWGKYEVRIRSNGKSLNLGAYVCPEEAYAVYLAKKRELHKGCTI